MPNEQLPENLGLNDHAKALLQRLESGEKLDPTLRQQLQDALVTKASEKEVSGDVKTVASDTTEALKSVTVKVSLDNIEARDDNEANVLRAVRTLKMLLKKGNRELTSAEEEESKWYDLEFDMERPENRNAMIAILRDYAKTIALDDVGYFFQVFSRGGDKEWSRISGNDHVPKGYSEGDLLEIRRNFIQRYLNEIPEDEDDPYNSPRLWYGYLIRPDVYCYERGEDVRFLVGGAIEGYGSQEAVRSDRAAYVRGVLNDTLKNLDREKDVVAKLEQLYAQYPSSEYTFEFAHRVKGRGEIVIKKRGGDEKVVRNIRPEKPMIAQDFDVIR